MPIFEIENVIVKLTRNPSGTGMFDMSNPANTNGGLGGGIIRPSAGKGGAFEIATGSSKGDPFGGRGATHNATFWLLQY